MDEFFRPSAVEHFYMFLETGCPLSHSAVLDSAAPIIMPPQWIMKGSTKVVTLF